MTPNKDVSGPREQGYSDGWTGVLARESTLYPSDYFDRVAYRRGWADGASDRERVVLGKGRGKL